LPGVESAQVNFRKAEAVVKFDSAKVKPAELAAAVTAAGFGAEIQGDGNDSKSEKGSKAKTGAPAGKERADATAGNGDAVAAAAAEKIDPDRQIVFQVKGLT
jgi:cation transport ATPase